MTATLMIVGSSPKCQWQIVAPEDIGFIITGIQRTDYVMAERNARTVAAKLGLSVEKADTKGCGSCGAKS